MKLFLIIVVLFLSSCAGSGTGNPLIKNMIGKDVIYEGIGIDGLRLGDDTNRIIQFLGKYNYNVFANDYIQYNKLSLNLGILHHICGNNIFRYKNYPEFKIWNIFYHTRDLYLFDQPFFATVYVFYDLGLEIFVNEKGRIIEFLIYCNANNETPIPYAESDLKISSVNKKINSFKGILDDLNVDPNNLTSTNFFSIINQGEYSGIQYDSFFFFKENGKLFALSIISPLIGGEKNISLMSFQLSSHDLEVMQAGKAWKDKYGECYIRLEK